MFLANTFALATLVLCAAGSPVPDAPSWPVFPVVESPEDERVHLGDEPVEDYPSIVSLGFVSGGGYGTLCGGSLITDRHILTAAHCYISNLTTFRAVFGSRHRVYPQNDGADTIEFGLDAWTLNPGYKGESNGHIYDTAVITLPRKVKLSNAIKITRLAKEVIPKNIRVVGWGRMDCYQRSPDYYLYARGQIVDDQTCSYFYRRKTHESQICARFINHWGQPSGSDVGDSGGPLYATAEDGEDVQIGVVSLGKVLNRKTPRECVNTEVPVKFGKVSEAEVFIKSVAPEAQFI